MSHFKTIILEDGNGVQLRIEDPTQVMRCLMVYRGDYTICVSCKHGELCGCICEECTDSSCSCQCSADSDSASVYEEMWEPASEPGCPCVEVSGSECACGIRAPQPERCAKCWFQKEDQEDDGAICDQMHDTTSEASDSDSEPGCRLVASAKMEEAIKQLKAGQAEIINTWEELIAGIDAEIAESHCSIHSVKSMPNK